MGELEELWYYNKHFKEKHIKQILSWTANFDEEKKKEELRKLFSIIPISQIEKYVNECIQDKFEENGYVFQDLVNELGKRIGFDVIFGRYKGVKGKNGFDGIWKSKEGVDFVVESKVTDLFPIKLEKIHGYKEDLIEKGEISKDNSYVILVLGRVDSKTAQSIIRGSQYKWNTVQIGIESLLLLAKKRNEILDKQIIAMFKSEDNVNVDEIVHLLFPIENNKQIKDSNKLIISSEKNIDKKRVTAINFYDKCIIKIENKEKIKLHKKQGKTKNLYENENKQYGIVITNAKKNVEKNYDEYWFAYHQNCYKNVSEYAKKYIAFGCGSEQNLLLVPIDFMEKNKQKLNKTNVNNRIHWHVFIIYKDKKFYLKTPLSNKKMVDVSKYKI